jgi:hypothetical protein
VFVHSVRESANEVYVCLDLLLTCYSSWQKEFVKEKAVVANRDDKIPWSKGSEQESRNAHNSLRCLWTIKGDWMVDLMDSLMSTIFRGQTRCLLLATRWGSR